MIKLTPQTIEQINALYKEGISVLKISKITGHDRMSVRRHISGFVSKPRANNTGKREEAIKMYLEGISIKEIAEILGVRVPAVRNYLPNEIKKSYQKQAHETNPIELEGISPTIMAYLMGDGTEQSPGRTVRKLHEFGLSKREANDVYWNWRYLYVRGDLKEVCNEDRLVGC